MTGETENAMFEILKRIQADLGEVKRDVSDVKRNLTELRHDVDERFEATGLRLGKLDDRLTGVEGRLAGVENRLTRVEHGFKAQRRDIAGLLVLGKSAVGDLAVQIEAVERRTAALERAR